MGASLACQLCDAHLFPGNTIYVRNDAVANDIVGSVEATDSDGTAPGNLVRYQIGLFHKHGQRQRWNADRNEHIPQTEKDVEIRNMLQGRNTDRT
jgi:hypothetical protein